MALTKITSDVIETGAITSDKLASGAVSASSLSSITTDNVSEGSTNTYFTNARARGSISVTGGNLSYDSGTGVIQLTTDQIRTAVSGGTGVSISAGEISIGQDVATSSTPTFGNITTTGYIAGPATFTIDPAAVGNNTGTVVIAGNLQVDGTTTTINSTTMEVDDLNITLASGAANAAAANGAGITVDGASATITYDGTNDEWDFNKDINVTGTVVADGLTVDTSTLVVDSTNNRVGIGTSSPAHTLTVEADKDTWISRIYNTGSDANAQGLLVRSDATAAHDATVMGVYTDGGYKMVVRSTGRVGIGTTSPNAAFKLDVEGAVRTNGTGLYVSENYSSGNNVYKIYENSNEFRIESQIYGNANTASSPIVFATSNTDGRLARMTIDSSGNVGIGTTLPSAIGNYKVLQLRGNSTTNGGLIRLETSNGTSGVARFYAGSGSTVLESNSNTPLTFGTNATTRMTIDTSGNVGIAAIPSGEAAAAHVVRLGDRVCISEYDDGSNPEQFNLLHNSDSSETYIETGYATNIQQRNGDITFKTAASGSAGAAITFSDRLKILNNGKVGIGESEPSNAKLEILQAGDHDAHSTHGIAIHSTGNTNFTSMYIGCEDAIDSAYIQAVALDGSFTSKSLLLNANGGKVGIQKTSPYYNLHVEEAIAAYTSNAAGSYTIDSNTIILTKYAAGNADANQNENTDDIYFTKDDFGFPNSAYGVNVVGYFYASNRLSGVSNGTSGHIWRVAGSLDSGQTVAMSFVNVVDNAQSFGGGTALKIIGNFNSTSERFEFGVTWEYGAGGYGTVTFIGQATEAMG